MLSFHDCPTTLRHEDCLPCGAPGRAHALSYGRKAQVRLYAGRRRELDARGSRERNNGVVVCAWLDAC